MGIPKVSGEFVARMEDVLDLYSEEYDPERPVVCFEETSKQLIEETREPIGTEPGRVQRYDYSYRRNGTRNLFMFCEPKGGWRHLQVTERRTSVDFADQMRCWLTRRIRVWRQSGWYWTTSTPTNSVRCTRRSSLPKRGA